MIHVLILGLFAMIYATGCASAKKSVIVDLRECKSINRTKHICEVEGQLD